MSAHETPCPWDAWQKTLVLSGIAMHLVARVRHIQEDPTLGPAEKARRIRRAVYQAFEDGRLVEPTLRPPADHWFEDGEGI